MSDLLVTVTALYLAYKQQELRVLFTRFKPATIWPIWICIGIIGLLINIGLADIGAWNEFFEFRWILTFLCLIYLFDQVDRKEVFLKYLTPLIIILNAVSIFIYFKTGGGRATGILGATMPFSHNIGLVSCLYLFIVLKDTKNIFARSKLINVVAFLTSFFLMAVTLTRGVWIGFGLGVAVASFRWNIKLFAKVSTALVAVSIIGILANQNIARRVFNRSIHETQSNDERIALWRANWEIIKDNPIFGVGYGQNKNHLRKYYDELGYPQDQKISHAHNQYLQIWGGMGTLGLLCFLTFIFFLIRAVYIKENGLQEKALKYGLLAAIVSFQIGALTEANFNIAKNRYFFLTFAAMAYSLGIPKKSLRRKNSSSIS